MNLLNLLDIAMLSVILVCGFEVVRTIHPRREPWKAVAFVLITVGAFGWINYDIAGHHLRWFAMWLHAGFALSVLVVMHASRVRRQRAAGLRRTREAWP